MSAAKIKAGRRPRMVRRAPAKVMPHRRGASPESASRLGEHVATSPYDSADYLDTPRRVALYLSEAFADGDPRLIAHALGVASRAKGMTEIAKASKRSRETLYRTLSADGNPELDTLVAVLDALGLRLAVEVNPIVASRRS